MSAKEIAFEVEVPEVRVIPRLIEVSCGDSQVFIRQIMSRSDEEWTVYGPNPGMGLVGKVDNAPHAKTSEALLPWAEDLVDRQEAARRARWALSRLMDDKPHPVRDDDDQPAPDQG